MLARFWAQARIWAQGVSILTPLAFVASRANHRTDFVFMPERFGTGRWLTGTPAAPPGETAWRP